MILFALVLAGEVLPTDVELHAAYCTGRLLGDDPDLSKLPPELRAKIQKTIDEKNVAMAKYGAYVKPRLGIVNTDALWLAMKQGELARDRIMADCADANSDTCMRARRDIDDCREARFLPF